MIEAQKPPEATRREFFLALAASVFVAGVPLPIGLRRDSLLFVNDAALPGGDGLSWLTAYQTLQPATAHIEPGGTIMVKGMHAVESIDGSAYPSAPVRFEGHDGGFHGIGGDIHFEGHAVLRNLTLEVKKLPPYESE